MTDQPIDQSDDSFTLDPIDPQKLNEGRNAKMRPSDLSCPQCNRPVPYIDRGCYTACPCGVQFANDGGLTRKVERLDPYPAHLAPWIVECGCSECADQPPADLDPEGERYAVCPDCGREFTDRDAKALVFTGCCGAVYESSMGHALYQKRCELPPSRPIEANFITGGDEPGEPDESPPSPGPCPECGDEVIQVFEHERFDGEWAATCTGCGAEFCTWEACNNPYCDGWPWDGDEDGGSEAGDEPEPDADVMGELHSRYGVEAEPRTPSHYVVELTAVTLDFHAYDSDRYGVYVTAHNTEAMPVGRGESESAGGYTYSTLSAACDAADAAALEMLEETREELL